MNRFLPLLGLAFLMFCSALTLHAQIPNQSSNPQVLCFGAIEPYCVDCTENGNQGTPGSTYAWSILSGPFSGTIGANPAYPSSNHIIIDWDDSPVGNYVLQVIETNANGCAADPIQLNIQIQQVTATAAANPVLCFGGNATVTVSATGGTAPYTGTGTFSVPAGTYSYIVSDVNGCADTVSVTVTQPAAPLTASATASPAACNGAATGSVSLSVSGGTSGYAYAWSNGATTQNLTGVAAGTYTVTVTDANGCTAQASATVTEPPLLTASATSTPAGCNGALDGTVTLTVSGGTSGYSYAWSNGATTQNLSGVASGTYSVTVTDANGCTAQTSATVSQPNALTASASATPAGCNGASTGTLSSSASGGTSPYTYSWSNGAATQNVNGVAAGTYTVTVTDNNGCTAQASATVTEPTLLTASASATPAGCNGASTGSVNLSVSGGTTGYTYAWSNGATTQNLSGVAAGTYTVTVTDNNGCTAQASATVTEPPLLTASATASPAACNGAATGSVSLSVSGGTSGYAYAWSNGATTQNLTGVAAGTYTVTVTDANGCTAQASATVTEPPLLTASATSTPAGCNGALDGTVTLTVSGGTSGYSYAWSNGATTQNLSGVASGTYSVTVTDANGCTAQTSATVSQPNALTASASATPAGCNGASTGTLSSSASGGTSPYTYSWSNGAATQNVNGVAAGTYTVTVTDNNGCTAQASATVTEPTLLTASASATPAGCNGASTGSVNLSVSGGTTGYTYAWSNGATTQNLSGVAAGTYTVTVTDNNGCTAQASATVTEPPLLTASATASPAACNGAATGSVSLSVSGGTSGYAYAWSNGATTQNLTGVAAGTYTVTVTDANGCTAQASATVTEPPLLTASATTTPAGCNGALDGTVTLTVSGGTSGYSYAWSNGATTQNLSGVASGTYSVTVTDANGCTAQTSATVSQPNALTASASATPAGCNGASTGTLSSSASGGTSPYTYSWSNGAATQNVNGVAAGTYTVTVTDNNGCTAQASATVTEPTLLTASASATPAGCNGASTGSVNLSVSGGTTGYTYAWSNGATTQNLSGVAAGTYTVTVTDNNGCTAQASATVTEPAPFSVDVTAGASICYEGSALFTFSGGPANGIVNITVNGVAQTVTLDASGSYTLIVDNATSDVTVNTISVSNGTCTYSVTDSGTVPVSPEIITSPISHD